MQYENIKSVENSEIFFKHVATIIIKSGSR